MTIEQQLEKEEREEDECERKEREWEEVLDGERECPYCHDKGEVYEEEHKPNEPDQCYMTPCRCVVERLERDK
jgi:hypothetical protein